MGYGIKKHFHSTPLINDAVYDQTNGKFYAVCSGGQYFVANVGDDAWNYRYLSIYSTSNLTTIKKSTDSYFYTFGASGKMWRSPDGISYTNLSSPVAVQLNDLVDVSAVATSLPYGSTSLLMHFDGADASTTFTDSANSFTVSRVGNTVISTAQSQFGGASAYFDGAGDYLTVPDNAAWDFAGPFCVEMWYRPTGNSGAGQALASNWKWSFGTNSGWRINATPGTGKVYFGANDGNTWNAIPFQLTGTTTIQLNTWYHIAITRDASNMVRMFVNGNLEASGTMSFNPVNTQNDPIRIGCSSIDGEGKEPVFGYIDELRIVKNEAVYTSAFTPPTSQLSTLTTNLSMTTYYAICGASGNVIVSSNGTTWAQTPSTSTTSNSLNSIATNGTIYVCVGASGTIITTTDFGTWTARTSGTTSQFNKVCWANDRFVAVGASGVVSFSLDGITWSTTTLSASGLSNVTLYDVTYSKYQFIACGDSGYVIASTNGNKWVISTNTNTSYSFRVIVPTTDKLYFMGSGVISRTTGG